MVFVKSAIPQAGDPTGEAPSPEISPERLGFVDAVIDRDKILRRQLLSLNVSDLTDTCSATNNLSFLLALALSRQPAANPTELATRDQ